MKITMEFNTKYIIFVALAMLLSSFSGYAIRTMQEPSQINLSDADFNRMVNLEIVGGQCERLGLQPSIFWQQDAEGNSFGIPICLGGNVNGQ